jgi:hypothetical protein
MAWANSGIYASTLAASLAGTANAPQWNSTSNKFYLTNNSEVTNYAAALASAIYANTNEVTGTGWAAGGIAVSALAAGSTSMGPTTTVSGTSPVLMVWGMTNSLSVASTTLSSIYGGYFYGTVTTNYKILGVYFGGTPYATVAGTFAITWSSGQVATVNVASAA